MTNDEVIVRINNLIKIIKSPRSIVPYCPEEMEALDLAIKVLNIQESLEKKIEFLMNERPQGEWIDHSDDYGYVECPFCHELTTCSDNADELHYCWKCGAEMRKGEDK